MDRNCAFNKYLKAELDLFWHACVCVRSSLQFSVAVNGEQRGKNAVFVIQA